MPNKAGFPFENTRNKLLERSKAFRKAKTLLFATVAPHMKLHRLVKFSSKFRLRILRHAQNFNRTNSIWFSLLLVRFRSLFLAQSSKNSTDKETQGRPDWRVNKKHATEVQKRQGTMVKDIVLTFRSCFRTIWLKFALFFPGWLNFRCFGATEVLPPFKLAPNWTRSGKESALTSFQISCLKLT